MSEQILWYSGSTPLHKEGERWGKNALSDEQRKAAQNIRRAFGRYAITTRRATRCGGDASRVYGGLAIAYHSRCCDDFLYRWRKPVPEAFKDFIATEDCSIEGIKAQAEFALRLYQRMKSECKPNSRSGVNKASVAKYRAYRQEWVGFLNYWEEISG